MPPNENKNCYCERGQKRVCQGDIIRNLDLTISSKTGNTADFSLTPSFSYGVVLSQECDLEQHYNCLAKNLKETDENKIKEDKIIETLLVCPAFSAERFYLGDHIVGKKMTLRNTKSIIEKIKKNEEYNRFHYLPAIQDKMPELVIDFKRFYTLPLEIFNENFEKFHIASIKELYRERLSQRFINYLGRIGLPDYQEANENE